MPFKGDKPPEGPATVYVNDDRRRKCEETECKRIADLRVVLGSPPTGKKGHYWCVSEHWIQARSVLVQRKISIRYAEGSIDRIIDRLSKPEDQR